MTSYVGLFCAVVYLLQAGTSVGQYVCICDDVCVQICDGCLSVTKWLLTVGYVQLPTVKPN